MTLRAGVVGYPIKHSLSPLLHGAWLDALGIDGVYAQIEVAPEAFADFVARNRGGGDLVGVNVTIPHKEAALALADVVDPVAAKAGAANLLLFHKDGTVEARNTDGIGLLDAFGVQAPGFDITAAPVLLLGAGGAARGAIAALVDAGVTNIRLINRTLHRAQVLAAQFPGVTVVPPEDAFSIPAANTAGAIINATSLGLNGGGGPHIHWPETRADVVAMDMVYKPLRTQFLSEAAAQNRRTVDGLEMLIRQAVPSFEAFYGAPPPLDRTDVRALALAALGEAP